MAPVTKIIAGEIQYDTLLTHDLNFLSNSEIQQLNDGGTTMKRMRAALMQKLKAESEADC